MLAIFVVLILFGLAATGALFALLKSFAKKTTKGGSSEMLDADRIIKELDQGIDRALQYLDQMLPLTDAVLKEQEIAALRGELAVEAKKLADLDAQLTKLQQAVEVAEAAHNELKKGIGG